ncbi:hypothetical protein [Methanosarcina sp. UBA5]|uniref:hypothetical protein n=1 Tax=Methanosarcina sp. UBA5 TaxID=1915593 RepID=UPI0025F69D3D|nr:hypothetical protein [Methanosarcina sp. UBA5]
MADTNVTVEACSWEYDNLQKILTVSTSVHPSNFKVLKNGDCVPDISGFQYQDSIEKFVKKNVDNGSIKLKENEAIYIFELGNENLSSSGADFQDLVVLISVNGVEPPESALYTKYKKNYIKC